jgi:hypothetical protein
VHPNPPITPFSIVENEERIGSGVELRSPPFLVDILRRRRSGISGLEFLDKHLV